MMRKPLFYLPVIFAVLLSLVGGFGLHRAAHAQVTTLPGQVFPNNFLAPTAGAQMAAVGGIVSNPSGLVAQVSPGVVFCYTGGALEVPPVQITLSASKSFILVFNCGTQNVYAKGAVTGPGTPSPDQPGVTSTLLVANYPVEIPIATVVCGASTCGTITDARVPGQWLVGVPTGAHMLTPLASGDTAFTVTLAGNTATKTWTIPYQVAPIVVCTDQTTAQLVKAAPTTTNVVVSDTVGATDVIACVVFGNPN